jgi:aerobic carbon-monoxide dehydrogenase medium subunit
MKPAPFDYLSPATLDEALAMMDENGFGAKLLAGGQSLIPTMNFRLAQPALLVDLNGVGELNKLHPDESHGVRIGAMVRHGQVEHSQVVRDLAPLLFEVMPHIAHPQIRNRGTIGGSLAHADPASELPVVMVALQAGFRLKRLGSERWVNARDFFAGLFTTVLEPEEILVDIAVPPKMPKTGYAFLELARRHGDYAQAGVAAVVTLGEEKLIQEVHLVYLNAGEIPIVAQEAADMLKDEQASQSVIEEAAHHASRNEIDPSTDIHDTAEYKRHLAFVLAKRAISLAVERAGENS